MKNAVEYEVVVGYNVYSSSYNIASDRLTDTDWSKETPLYSATSDTLYFYWWNIDSAAGVLSSAVAALALLNTF